MGESTILILGNGPSIDRLDPRIFDAMPVWGANQIYLKFPEWGRETDAIFITDPYRLREIGGDLSDYGGELFIGDFRYIDPPANEIRSIVGRGFTPLRQLANQRAKGLALLRRMKIRSWLNGHIVNRDEVSFDFDRGYRFGGSVVFSMIQHAVYCGYKRILLSGVDASFKPGSSYFTGLNKEPRFAHRDVPQNVRMTMEPVFVLLQVYFEDIGVELIDCTPGGALKFIAKGDLADFLGPSVAVEP